MVAPAWLSDQHHEDHSSSLGRWTMVLRGFPETSVSDKKLQQCNFLDVARAPSQPVFASYKNKIFLSWMNDVVGNASHHGRASVAPTERACALKNSKSRSAAPKHKFGSLKMFSKKLIVNLVEEQRVIDNLKIGSIGINHCIDYTTGEKKNCSFHPCSANGTASDLDVCQPLKAAISSQPSFSMLNNSINSYFSLNSPIVPCLNYPDPYVQSFTSNSIKTHEEEALEYQALLKTSKNKKFNSVSNF